jgi:sugar lactone lactonase YvrE
MTFGPDGNLYVIDSFHNAVLRYNGAAGQPMPSPGSVNAVFVPAGSGGLSGAGFLTFGPDGNLYVASFNNSQILRYYGATGIFKDVFVPGASGGLTFGPDANLYVASYHEHAVSRYNGVSGQPMPSPSGTGAFFVSAGSGGLSGPSKVAFGPDGNLYVTDWDSFAVLRYDGTTGQPLPTSGNAGAVFVTAGSGGLNQPESLGFGPDGKLYVASYSNHVVLRYSGTTGTFMDTFASTQGLGIAVTPIDLAFSMFSCR